MTRDKFTQEVEKLGHENDILCIDVLLSLSSVIRHSANYKEASRSIDPLIEKFTYLLEQDPPISSDNYKRLAEYVNYIMSESKAMFLKNLSFDKDHLELHQISQIIQGKAKLDVLNMIAPYKIDYLWFYPEVPIEDFDTVIAIIPKVFSCLKQMYQYCENDPNNVDEDESFYSFDELSPFDLYRSLLGILPSTDSSHWDIDKDLGYYYTIANSGATTYYDLWKNHDFGKFIELLDWDNDYFIIPLRSILHDNSSNSKIIDTVSNPRLKTLTKQHETLQNIRQIMIKRVLENDDDEDGYYYNHEVDIVMERVSVLEDIISYLIRKLTIEIHEREEGIKLIERNRILSNLSHSIKNMLKAVIGPLQTLREEIPEKAAIIDNAIKGANLIREIVNAINLSFKTTIDELQWDVLNPGKESMSLQDMIADSLKYSIGNMFDFRYFPIYAENYFPRQLIKADFEAIKQEWNQAQQSIDAVRDFCDKQLFKLELDLDDSRDYHVGNEKSSAIKLMILFQEMIFNAVKYTSFMPHDERIVHISLTRHDAKLRLLVKNSYSDKVRAKTTGVGKLVIENFAKVLGCEPKIITEAETYSIEMEFDDIWRKDA
jgi:signal transduction histidine kinase